MGPAHMRGTIERLRGRGQRPGGSPEGEGKDRKGRAARNRTQPKSPGAGRCVPSGRSLGAAPLCGAPPKRPRYLPEAAAKARQSWRKQQSICMQASGVIRP